MIDDEDLDFDPRGSEVVANSPNSRVRVNINIKRSLHNDALSVAEAEDETFSTVVRRALTQYVREHKENQKT